ncbi:hypothetical protein S40288_04279 [Stachybotrys chartarum IBT 40288]|nr:hypothetical protein S40288_04279 [Stachybotrys chartarum IBT 40288]
MALPSIQAYIYPDRIFPLLGDQIGTKCEIRQYERMKNAKGEMVTLKAGFTRSSLVRNSLDEWSADAAIVLIRDMEDIEDPHTRLEIQSPYIKQALKECVPEHANFDLEHQALILEDQPRCVFHYRQNLIDYHNRCAERQEAEAAQHVAMLLNHMFRTFDQEIRQFKHYMESFQLQPSLSFVNLWMAFVPGQIAYAEKKCNHEKLKGRLFRLKKINRCSCTKVGCSRSSWNISGYAIDYDGADFGHTFIGYQIEPYDGVKPLQDLAVMPLQYHPDCRNIKTELIARGKDFVQLTGQHHKAYKGIAALLSDHRDIHDEDNFPLQSTHVDSRIVVDCQAFSDARPTHQPWFIPSEKRFRTSLDEHLKMSDEELMICADAVAGYSLNEKRWGWFDVKSIRDVEFNKNAFNALILEESQKTVLLSLVHSRKTKNEGFDDMIKGKGKGLVFLLHGTPGTGKTLTAESIADHTESPLIRVDTGILGSQAKQLQEALHEVLNLAERWKATVLLDEADVFLQERNISDIERNMLVAVFLTELEYFSGVLFLTTNRVATFDRAFMSRIHLTIFYPPLGPSSRALVWKNILTQSGMEFESDVVEPDLIASMDDDTMSGRHIKNLIQIACTLATGEGKPLSKSHLRLAKSATISFDSRLATLVAQDEEDGRVDSTVSRVQKRRRIGDDV